MGKRAIRPVAVRGVTIGEGLPKICMPLVARDAQELQAAAQEAAQLCPDLVEWRADCYAGLGTQEVPGLLARLRGWVGEKPILFTFRSRQEGGARELGLSERQQLMLAAAGAGADLLDAELSMGEEALAPVLACARQHGVPVVLSCHFFDRTPPEPEMVEILRREQACGADIAKLAVMPHSPADVLALLGATLTMRERFAGIPLITMAMGALGMPSRVCGGIFGSGLSFGAGSRTSAPGQLAVGELREFLKAMQG